MAIAERMDTVDAAWLGMDRPHNLMIVTSVVWFETAVDWDRALDALQERLIEPFPRFRQRVVEPAVTIGPWTGPAWQDDEDFSLDKQLHRARLDGDDPEEALQRYVAGRIDTPLSTDRPLWEAHLLDGYGKGSAVLLRSHHALADGTALVQVLLGLADPPEVGRHPDQRELAPPGPRQPAARSALAAARAVAGPLRVAGRLGQQALQMARRPGDAVRGDLASLSKLARQPADRLSLSGTLTGDRLTTWTDPVPLDEVKQQCKEHGCTVNDLALAVITGALRRYLVRAGEPLDVVRAVVPFDLRPSDRPLSRDLGNAFGLVFVDLPVERPTPADRIRSVKRRLDTIKDSRQGIVVFGALGLMGQSPKQLAHRFTDVFINRASLVITNIAGPRQQLTFTGAPVAGFMLWVPASGQIGVGLSIVSYAGSLRLGISVDHGVVPDPDLFADDVRAELAEVLAPT